MTQQPRAVRVLNTPEGPVILVLDLALNPFLICEGYVASITAHIMAERKRQGLDPFDTVRVEISAERVVLDACWSALGTIVSRCTAVAVTLRGAEGGKIPLGHAGDAYATIKVEPTTEHEPVQFVDFEPYRSSAELWAVIAERYKENTLEKWREAQE